MHFIGWVITDSGTLDEVARVLAPFNEQDEAYMTERIEDGDESYFVNPNSEWDYWTPIHHDWAARRTEGEDGATFPIGEASAHTLPHTIFSAKCGVCRRTWVEPDRLALVSVTNWDQVAARELAHAGGKFITCIDYHI